MRSFLRFCFLHAYIFPPVCFVLFLILNELKLVRGTADEKKQDRITFPVTKKILSYVENDEYRSDLGHVPHLRGT